MGPPGPIQAKIQERVRANLHRCLPGDLPDLAAVLAGGAAGSCPPPDAAEAPAATDEVCGGSAATHRSWLHMAHS